jgi:hypothetical protein
VYLLPLKLKKNSKDSIEPISLNFTCAQNNLTHSFHLGVHDLQSLDGILEHYFGCYLTISYLTINVG